MSLIEIMKALSDETRLRIASILKDEDLCVCEIEVLLGINQSNTSRHLNRLLSARIVEYYKKAQYVFYKINWDTVREYPFIKEILDKETPKLKLCINDNERLKQYKNSKLTCDDIKNDKVCFCNEC